MGATVFNNTIYIDKELSEKLTPGERSVLIAHELGHVEGRDRLKIIAFMFMYSCATAASLIFTHFIVFMGMMMFFVPITNFYRKYIELKADVYALQITKDFDSFISLMDKLEHDGSTHPAKAERIQIANKMRKIYEHS